MNSSLVMCMMLALAAAFAAAASAFLDHWGWLAILGIYSAAGSLTLVASACVMQSLAPKLATAVRRPEPSAEVIRLYA